MRILRTIVLALAIGPLAVPATALADPPATPPRADEWVQVWCQSPDGTAGYERVDIHAVDQGNKDVQVAAYGLHHDGWICQIGPF